MSEGALTYADLAAKWRIHPRHVRRVCTRLKLEPMDMGHRTKRFRPADVDRAEERGAQKKASNPLTKKRRGAKA